MKKHYIMVIDQERCIGCEACSVACKNENKGGQGYIRVTTQDASQKDTPAGTLLSVENGYTLKPEAGTGPSVYYCPPKKPRGL